MTRSDRLTVEFSEGFLIFFLEEKEPATVLDVRSDGQVMIKLPGNEPGMTVVISPGGAFISGCNDHSYYIWKRNAEEPDLYQVFQHRDGLTNMRKTNFTCIFSNDSKVAVVSSNCFLPHHVIDLDTGHSQGFFFENQAIHKLFYIAKKRILTVLSHKAITFFDMDSGAVLGRCYQRYLEYQLARETIRLSPKETILAFPDTKSDMVLFRSSIPPNPSFDDNKRVKMESGCVFV